MKLKDLLPNAALVLAWVRKQTFVFHDEGRTYRFDVNAAWEKVEASPRPFLILSLKETGIDEAHIRARFPDVDWEYARSRDLSQPLLFVPWRGGACQIIDGCHRLAKAVQEGVTELPAYVLTEAQRDAIMEEITAATGGEAELKR